MEPQVLKAQHRQEVGTLEIRLEAREAWPRTWENGVRGRDQLSLVCSACSLSLG